MLAQDRERAVTDLRRRRVDDPPLEVVEHLLRGGLQGEAAELGRELPADDRLADRDVEQRGQHPLGLMDPDILMDGVGHLVDLHGHPNTVWPQ